jgi:hypothetical protein
MPDYILFMHDDAAPGPQDWEPYFKRLRASGAFQGGSAIGDGVCARKTGATPPVTTHLAGYIRITAQDLDDARTFLEGNPVYEAGGTVEIRELPRD